MYTILQAKQSIRDGIKTYLEKDNDGNYLMDEVNCLPFYLEGAPGIGKTQIVGQLAKEMGIGYVSFSLVHHTRNSLLGLPVITELENGDKFTSFTMSEIIAKVYEQMEKGFSEGILLLDEFPCMSETVMPAMLAFLQTKNIGTHTLPRGWIIVLCGNPAKYNKATHSFDAAVTDRIRKIEIEYKVGDFLKYAMDNNLSKTIISYLEINPEHIYRYVKDKQHEELVTCRSWENLSHTLTVSERLNNSVDEELIGQFIKSDEIANKFAIFYRNQLTGMTIEETKKILAGKITENIVNRYKDMSLNKKWNLSSYLKSSMEKEVRDAERAREEIRFAKKVMQQIKLELETSLPFDTNSILSDINDIREMHSPYDFVRYNNKNSEAIGQCIKDNINRFSSDLEIINIDPKNLIDEWSKLVVYKDDAGKYAKSFVKMLDKWIIERTNVQENAIKEVGVAVGNIFDFLDVIDESESLSERFYVEVCNNQTLLKAACIADCKSFAAMCRKHYGMNIA